MGLLNLTESERLEILNLHNNARIIKEQVAPVTGAAAPAAAPQTVADVIKELQTVLNTKYGTKLVVDGKWGNLTQTAFETAMKSKSAVPAPAAGTTPAPAAGPDVVGAEAPQQLSQASQQALGGQLTPQQIRQQSRFDQRLARQARRTERRAQQ